MPCSATRRRPTCRRSSRSTTPRSPVASSRPISSRSASTRAPRGSTPTDRTVGRCGSRRSTARVVGWLSFSDFYGRPAYGATVEVSVYLAEAARGRGLGAAFLRARSSAAPRLGVRTLLGFIFGHNGASLALFERFGFARWGTLPRVASLDGVERDLVIVGLRVGETT